MNDDEDNEINQVEHGPVGRMRPTLKDHLIKQEFMWYVALTGQVRQRPRRSVGIPLLEHVFLEYHDCNTTVYHDTHDPCTQPFAHMSHTTPFLYHYL